MGITDSYPSQIDPKLKTFSENIWKKGRMKADPNHAAPTISREGKISGETWPKVLPENPAEKWGVLSQNTHRNIGVSFDPKLPQILSIDENGQILGILGFNFNPETLKEKQFLDHRLALAMQKKDN